MTEWILQDAKARFSELVNHCLEEGPQFVTRYGKPAVVVIPQTQYEELTAPHSSLGAFFRSAPRVEADFSRSQDMGREVVL